MRGQRAWQQPQPLGLAAVACKGVRVQLRLGPVSSRSSRRCPNLTSVTLSGCGHVTDDCLARLLLSCPRLRALRLENCARVTNRTLAAVAAHGRALQTLHVDFCRNVSAAGLLRLRAACPNLILSAEHSAAMIPDQPPRARVSAATLFSAAPGRQSVPHPTGS